MGDMNRFNKRCIERRHQRALQMPSRVPTSASSAYTPETLAFKKAFSMSLSTQCPVNFMDSSRVFYRLWVCPRKSRLRRS